MTSESIDEYLDTLLSFGPTVKDASPFCRESVSLIHVPASGPETVYTLSLRDKDSVLTVARFKAAVWEEIVDASLVDGESKTEVEILRAEVEGDHPVFEFLNDAAYERCANRSEGQPGMEYYLLIRDDGHAGSVAECWEPYGIQDQAWMTVIGAMQALSSQFEYAVQEEQSALAMA